MDTCQNTSPITNTNTNQNVYPLMLGGNKKDTYTQANLKLSAAGLFMYMWPFCYHQELRVKCRHISGVIV